MMRAWELADGAEASHGSVIPGSYGEPMKQMSQVHPVRRPEMNGTDGEASGIRSKAALARAAWLSGLGLRAVAVDRCPVGGCEVCDRSSQRAA